MMRTFRSKHHLTLSLLPFVALIGVAKWYVHANGIQPMELNAYFSTLVAADVFLLGFLLSGAMPDYKEAEKIPGEMAAALDSIVEECETLRSRKPSRIAATACLEHTRSVIAAIKAWFNHKQRTGAVIAVLRAYNATFAAIEPHTQANFLVRLKQEVASVRRMVIRMRNIREASVVAPAYAVAELFTAVVIFSLLFVDMGTLLESVLITTAISYLLIYMILLIRDLDNPFQYHDKAHVQDEIAIEPLDAVDRTIRGILKAK
jgi:hypothetical protein